MVGPAQRRAHVALEPTLVRELKPTVGMGPQGHWESRFSYIHTTTANDTALVLNDTVTPPYVAIHTRVNNGAEFYPTQYVPLSNVAPTRQLFKSLCLLGLKAEIASATKSLTMGELSGVRHAAAVPSEILNLSGSSLSALQMPTASRILGIPVDGNVTLRLPGDGSSYQSVDGIFDKELAYRVCSRNDAFAPAALVVGQGMMIPPGAVLTGQSIFYATADPVLLAGNPMAAMIPQGYVGAARLELHIQFNVATSIAVEFTYRTCVAGVIINTSIQTTVSSGALTQAANIRNDGHPIGFLTSILVRTTAPSNINAMDFMLCLADYDAYGSMNVVTTFESFSVGTKVAINGNLAFVGKLLPSQLTIVPAVMGTDMGDTVTPIVDFPYVTYRERPDVGAGADYLERSRRRDLQSVDWGELWSGVKKFAKPILGAARSIPGPWGVMAGAAHELVSKDRPRQLLSADEPREGEGEAEKLLPRPIRGKLTSTDHNNGWEEGRRKFGERSSEEVITSLANELVPGATLDEAVVMFATSMKMMIANYERSVPHPSKRDDETVDDFKWRVRQWYYAAADAFTGKPGSFMAVHALEAILPVPNFCREQLPAVPRGKLKSADFEPDESDEDWDDFGPDEVKCSVCLRVMKRADAHPLPVMNNPEQLKKVIQSFDAGLSAIDALEAARGAPRPLPRRFANRIRVKHVREAIRAAGSGSKLGHRLCMSKITDVINLLSLPYHELEAAVDGGGLGELLPPPPVGGLFSSDHEPDKSRSDTPMPRPLHTSDPLPQPAADQMGTGTSLVGVIVGTEYRVYSYPSEWSWGDAFTGVLSVAFVVNMIAPGTTPVLYRPPLRSLTYGPYNFDVSHVRALAEEVVAIDWESLAAAMFLSINPDPRSGETIAYQIVRDKSLAMRTLVGPSGAQLELPVIDDLSVQRFGVVDEGGEDGGPQGYIRAIAASVKPINTRYQTFATPTGSLKISMQFADEGDRFHIAWACSGLFRADEPYFVSPVPIACGNENEADGYLEAATAGEAWKAAVEFSEDSPVNLFFEDQTGGSCTLAACCLGSQTYGFLLGGADDSGVKRVGGLAAKFEAIAASSIKEPVFSGVVSEEELVDYLGSSGLEKEVIQVTQVFQVFQEKAKRYRLAKGRDKRLQLVDKEIENTLKGGEKVTKIVKVAAKKEVTRKGISPEEAEAKFLGDFESATFIANGEEFDIGSAEDFMQAWMKPDNAVLNAALAKFRPEGLRAMARSMTAPDSKALRVFKSSVAAAIAQAQAIRAKREAEAEQEAIKSTRRGVTKNKARAAALRQTSGVIRRSRASESGAGAGAASGSGGGAAVARRRVLD